MFKICLDATFSGIPLTESFLMEPINSEKLYEKSFVTFFLVALMFFASNAADFEISTFNLTHNVPPSMSFE